MCAVSVVHDYFRDNTSPGQWTKSEYALLQEVLEKLTILDTKLGQPDCHDPAKAAWMREVEKRLKKLESDTL